MTARLNPYLNFRANAREAMQFYHSVFGGELTTSTFAEGGMTQNPADNDKIMHAQGLAPNRFCLMGADTPDYMEYTPGTNFAVSLSGSGPSEEAELRGYWDKLSEGGQVTMQLEKAPWGDTFGMLVDRFGVSWLVNISGTAQQG